MRVLSIDHEGYDVAKYLSGHGVAAFVLKYRLAKDKGSTYTVDGDEMADVERAVRMVKARGGGVECGSGAGGRDGLLGRWGAGGIKAALAVPCGL